MKIHLLAGISAALLMSTVLHAQQVLTYVADTGAQANTNWNKPLALPGFNSALGTLTQVKLTFTGNLLQTVFAENLQTSPSAYNMSTQANFRLTDAGSNELFNSGAITFNPTGMLAAFDGTLNFGGASGFTRSAPSEWSAIHYVPVFSSFITTGPIGFTATATNAFTNLGGGNFATGGSATAAARLEVEYSYTPIPETSLYAAILAALSLGLGVRRRERARVA